MNMQEYLAESKRTVSDMCDLSFVEAEDVTLMLDDLTYVTSMLDMAKKAFFYGKEPDYAMLNNYCQESYRFLGAEIEHIHTDVLHGVLGIVTESGEIADLLLKAMKDNELLDKVDLVDELGDLLWYMALVFRTLNVSFEEVAERNIAKLRARFPEKFTAEAAINRDKEKEKAAVA